MALQKQSPFDLSVTIAIVSILATAAVGLSARALSEHSPFLPPSHFEVLNKPAKPTLNNAQISERFTLRGISKIGDTYLFSIFDSRTKKAKWVEAGVHSNGFTITSYDPSSRTIDCRWNGHESSIKLVNADDAAVALSFTETYDTPVTKPSTNQQTSGTRLSKKSGIKRSYAQNDPARNTQESLQKLYFDSVNYSSGISSATPSSELSESGFTSDDSFAQSDDGLGPSDTPNVDLTPPAPFKVSRRNSVGNASGKKPDFMSQAEWTALLQSQ